MMNALSRLHRHGFFIILLMFFSCRSAMAHGEMVWNDFTIDNKNDSIVTSISQVRKVMGDIVLGRREVNAWPDRELLGMRDELEHLQEEHEALLNHFRETGVNILLQRELLANPRAGRSVAASHALETALALIEHVNSLADQTAFEEELHTEEKGAYMFDLMASHVDKMAIYSELVKAKKD